MLEDVPIIPTTESVDWFQYNTEDIARLADRGQPVRPARRLQRARHEQVLLHLYSKSAQK